MVTLDREEALGILHQKLDVLRHLPYSELAARAGTYEDVEEVPGASGATYIVEIQVLWDAEPGGDVRVLGGIDDGGWRAFVPLVEDFIVSRG